ncbi:hypothetical protein [Xanthomonas euvesicatoria]|uniref:hypothetical protein n=1 Tax=Xanthomonas euvesicatoria TaxID=456327 RepID=UPI0032B34075
MGLLEHGDDLAVGKAGLLHGTSSGKGTRKFHFWRLLIGGGITPVPQQGMPTPSPSVETQNGGNPLLTADKVAVARWFPGHCFAELYNKDPSFGGRLIPSCVVKVIQQVKADTGVTLTEADIKSPDVLAHFKHVYGDDNQWRH